MALNIETQLPSSVFCSSSTWLINRRFSSSSSAFTSASSRSVQQQKDNQSQDKSEVRWPFSQHRPLTALWLIGAALISVSWC